MTEVETLQAYSPLQSPFHIAGLAWFAQERLLRRLPKREEPIVNSYVEQLADCPAGGQIRFRTNSRCIGIRSRLAAAAGYGHMTAAGQNGYDLYVGDNEGTMRYAGTTVFEPAATEFEQVLLEEPERRMREAILYLPLHQRVEEVAVLLDPDAAVLPPSPFAGEGRLIFYGTSITQGGCAARPGMAYPSIIGRVLPYETINLGFSGSGKGEPEMAELIASIPAPAALILDYEANVLAEEQMEQTLPAFIRIYRQGHPLVPILVVSKIRLAQERFRPSLEQRRLNMARIQLAVVERLREEGDRQLFFVDGAPLLGEDFEACTVDGVHPTDLGFQRMAAGLAPQIRNRLA